MEICVNQVCISASYHWAHASYTSSTLPDSPPLTHTILHDPSFTPLATVSPDMASLVWGRVIAFATLPGHPDSLSVSDSLNDRRVMRALNFTRKSLTLVSKCFRVSVFTLSRFLALMGPHLGSYTAILFPIPSPDEREFLEAVFLVGVEKSNRCTTSAFVLSSLAVDVLHRSGRHAFGTSSMPNQAGKLCGGV
jgi:hypothetical protein